MTYYEIKDAENGEKHFNQVERFPNGFESWHETHFEVVQFITSLEDGISSRGDRVDDVRETRGIGGVYELARDWTDEFEEKYKHCLWDEEEGYFDTIEEFLTTKNKQI